MPKTSNQTFKYRPVLFALVLASFIPLTINMANADGNRVDIIHEGYDRFPSVGATVTLVRAGNAVIVCDPGMVKSQQLIIDGLKKHGLGVADITHVFLTHQHTDHSANLGLFPQAKIIDAYGIYHRDHWQEYKNDGYSVGPGVTVIATPGHSNEDLTLLVKTVKGTYAITHAWWHSDLTPVVDPSAEAPQKLKASRKRILSEADWIIPGHGGIVRNPEK